MGKVGSRQRTVAFHYNPFCTKRLKMREGIVREFGMDRYTLLYLKWITNKDLLYSTGNSARCYVAAWMGGEFGGEWIHVYI